MKYSQLPVLGEHNWLEHINKSFQEVGNMIQLSDRAEPIYLDGASKSSNDQMYVWQTIFNDDAGHQRTIVAGVGRVNHGAIKTGQHFTIKVPWGLGTGAQISSNVFNTSLWKGEMAADGAIQFIPLQDVSAGNDWIDFRVEWPF